MTKDNQKSLTSFYYSLIISSLIILICATGYAYNGPMATTTDAKSTDEKPAIIVLDEPPKLDMPLQFRTSHDDIAKANNRNINTSGLKDFKAAASAQFSWNTLRAALKKLPGPAIIVDLRQESHGFLNNRPISWYGNQNKENIGLSLKEIYYRERALLATVSQHFRLEVHEILEKDNGVIKETWPRWVRVRKVESEEMLMTRKRLKYIRLPVTDRHRPTDEIVDLFVRFTRMVPSNHWLYFHCRGGKGRTTTFMILMDCINNADKLSIEQIVARQSALGGADLFFKDLQNIPEWKSNAYKERSKFIRQFYQYVKDPNGYKKQDWLSWISSN